MSADKHTQGQWEQWLGTFGPYLVAHTPGQDKVLAKMHYSMTPDLTEEENTANVRLMAAAPELLAALRSVIEWQDCPVTAPERKELLIRNAARAAIVKATGGAS